MRSRKLRIHGKKVQKLHYDEDQTIPDKFLGINTSKNSNGNIILNQKHCLEEIDAPDLKQLQSFAKQYILPKHWQSTFRSLASKLNIQALSSRPDFTLAIKIAKRVKTENTDLKIPNFGNSKDWFLVGISDTSNKMRNEIFSIRGYIIMFINKKMEMAIGILWISKGSPNSIIKFRHDSEKLALKGPPSKQPCFNSLGFLP